MFTGRSEKRSWNPCDPILTDGQWAFIVRQYLDPRGNDILRVAVLRLEAVLRRHIAALRVRRAARVGFEAAGQRHCQPHEDLIRHQHFLT